jgi:hypothetical protein
MFKIFNQCNCEERLQIIEKKLKEFAVDLEKIDIKAMEAQRSYRAKLKRITGDVEEEKTETNKNPSVFLSPNGTPI